MGTEMERLSERQEQILDFIAREYIDSAAPVGSKTVVEGCALGVSSATVRADMAQMEKLGYLTHPHTSAGRMPTSAGYRYFVEFLMREANLPLTERRMIEHQFHQVDRDLEQWVRLAGAILTSKTHTASLVTPPRTQRCRVKYVELARISEANVLVSVALQDGTVRRGIASYGLSEKGASLATIAERMNALLAGLTAEEVRAKAGDSALAGTGLAGEVAELVGQADFRQDLELYRYGFANILRQPEFAAAEKVERVVGLLEEPGHLEAIVAEVAFSHGGVQVVIGGEGRWPQMSDFSLVLARYGAMLRTAGVVGLMGPVRMAYNRNVPMVSYVADLMSKLISETYI
jgi:heat-inducible transcriptional repressor